MATYTAIANGEIDAESPITDLLLGRLRDNPIAIAESDASVPITLRPYALLATLATTSGTSWTASGLNLTGFNFLLIFVDGFSIAAFASEPMTLNAGSGAFTYATTAASAANGLFRVRMVHLDSGVFVEAAAGEGTTNPSNTGITRATTSITFSTSSARTGDAGSIKLYGVK
jgi:hypothetical protein